MIGIKKSSIQNDNEPPKGEVIIEIGAYIDAQAKIGVAKEASLRAWLTTGRADPMGVVVGKNTIILDDVVVAEGTTIGANCFIDRATRIGYDCKISDGCRFEYRADICDRVQLGSACVIGGFLCDGAILADECVVLGSLVHRMEEPDLPWGQYERNPVLGRGVFVGMGAVVVGVSVGELSYIAANATVTKDIPPGSVVTGINKITPISKWPGKLHRSKVTEPARLLL